MPDPGHYARKQIHCPSRAVAWSHGSRFRLAQRLAAPARGGRLLDYGCGDGTFIALTHGTFSHAVGADVDAAQIADCRQRLGSLEHVEFVLTTALEPPDHTRAYDLVTCMETLEHCTDAERERVIGELARLCAPGGRIVISVPIEIGPALAGKQLFRAMAAWRGHGDYHHRETYTLRELAAAVLGRPRLARPVYRADTPFGAVEYCGHKGFDWRLLERDLRRVLRVERRLFTPMPLLKGMLNSQVWFVCRPGT
jgi:2-polyprenyl-3-methyl-5-hydroxy-6-metoxy-1,4-benzoquinol methylase